MRIFHITAVAIRQIVIIVYLIADHLPIYERSRFQKLIDNEESLSQEMKRESIQDHLRSHGHLTEELYQYVIGFKYDHEANKYLLELIRSQPPEYLDGLKEALLAAKQEQLIESLP